MALLKALASSLKGQCPPWPGKVLGVESDHLNGHVIWAVQSQKMVNIQKLLLVHEKILDCKQQYALLSIQQGCKSHRDILSHKLKLSSLLQSPKVYDEIRG